MPRLALVTDTVLALKEVSAGYGPVTVLKGITLDVCEREVVCIIGANGAGKTTALNVISGLVPISSGGAEFLGKSIADMPPHTLPSSGLAHVPEGRKIFTRMTVLENLQLGAFTRNSQQEFQEDLAMVCELFPILKDRSSQLGGTLSGGEQQMLAISRGLMSRPKILLLDEPSMGVAPLLTAKIFEALKKLNQSGMTILLVEQNAHLALRLAHRGYVLELGEIVLTDTGQALLDNPKVREAYLGD